MTFRIAKDMPIILNATFSIIYDFKMLFSGTYFKKIIHSEAKFLTVKIINSLK